jgi:uncharacterized protein (TIGR02996 family)
MSNLGEIHAAIVSAPDDDEPRLAYADAAESRDALRAEFIRLQVALARCRKARGYVDDIPLASGKKGYAYLREGDLIRQYGEAWAGPVGELCSWRVFLRGFVEWVQLDAATFLSIAPEVYRRAPVLHLDLNGVKPFAAELFASPYLERILSLNLARNDLGDAEARIIAASPRLAKLTWLELCGNRIGAAGFEALAASDKLPRLGYLGFRNNAAEDLTPQHADEYDATSPAAGELMRRYGYREWLSAHVRGTWPPARDAVWSE